MKKTFLILSMMLTSILSAFADGVYIEDFSIKAGETKEITLCFDSEAGFTNKGVSITFTLPEGLTLASDPNSPFALTDRCTMGMNNSKVNSSGVLKFIGVSATITAGTGAIATFSVTASEDFQGGDILMSAIKFAGISYDDVATHVTVVPAGEPTSISNISIINNGVIYDLSGRKIDNLVKGQTYIVNGKKVVTK